MKRLSDLTKEGLGLVPDAPVQLENHHPRWKRAAADEAYAIYDELRLESLRLHHVGSTAVPGLRAKPVLDLLGAVPSLEEYDAKAGALGGLGYENLGEYGIPGRRYSKLKNAEGRTLAHLHVFRDGDPQIARHLAFRDLLVKSAEAREAYEAAKLSVAGTGARGNERKTKS